MFNIISNIKEENIMKKILGAVLATTIVASTVLSGCSAATKTEGENSTQQAEEKAVTESAQVSEGGYEECTIRFDWWGGDSRHEATQKAVEAFMAKYPGITVDVNFGSWKDWESARALEYQSGTGSDLTQINYSWITDYNVDGKTFADLKQFSDIIDFSQYDENELAICEDVNGALAGVPIALTGRIFYWNKTTFDKAGIDTPKSLADLKAAGKVFAEKLGEDYYPLAVGEYDRAILMSFYLQAKYGKAVIDEELNFNYTEEELKDGLDFINSLEEEHVIPSIKTIDGDGAASFDVNQKFLDGKYAGILEWDSAAKKFITALGDAGELVVGEEFTDMGESTGVSTKVSMLYAITNTSEYKREAAMLLNFLINEPEGIELIGTQRGIPQSKIAYETLEKANAIDPVIAEAHTKVMDAAEFFFSPKFDDASLKGDGGAYKDVFGGISYGEYTTDEGAKILFDAYTNATK